MAAAAGDGPDRADVVVVGGGVIGLTAGWRLAEAGARVVVCDPAPGRGAVWAAAGMLAPVAESTFGEEALTPLFSLASAAWPADAARLEDAAGLPVHYRAEGALVAAADPSDLAATRRILDHQRARGLAATGLTASACREREPLLAPGVAGGAWLPRDHQVDNRALVAALLAAVGARGAVLLPAAVDRILVGDRGVEGVALAGGRQIAAATVVVAAGARSAAVDGVPDRWRPPVRPVTGTTLRLRAPDGTPRPVRTVRGLVHGRTCYVVPRDDGRAVVGASVEDRGFAGETRAGVVHDLLADARTLLPVLDEYVLEATTTGLRPGTPDNGPVVGRTGVGGLVMATGHYRNGILLAFVTADEVVRQVAGEADGESPFAPFRPDRFADTPAGIPPASPARLPGAAAR